MGINGNLNGIYARQSVVKMDSISIDTQIEKCKKEVDGENVRIYSDRKSGKDTNREGFQNMMEDVKVDMLSKVIVYKVDRISRSLSDFTDMMRIFEKHKVDFVSVKEKFDTSTPMGQAMLQLVMVFAELERKTIQQRVIDNYYARGRDGRYLGGKPPIGYDKEPLLMCGKKTYHYIENEEQSQLVQDIFFRYYSSPSESYGAIAKRLNEEGLHKTTRGNGWSNNTISRIIRNPAYTYATAEVCLYLKEKGCTITNSIEEFTGESGMYMYTEGGKESKKDKSKKTYITLAPHKPFIPAEMWLACNRKADGNVQIKNSGQGTYSWLSGLMKCGYCGLATTIATRDKGKHKLICGGKKRHSCKGVSTELLSETIESVVEPVLLEHLRTELAKSLLERKTVDTSNEREINSLNIRLVKIDEEIGNLVQAVATSGKKAAEMYNDKIEELAKEKEDTENKILELKSNNIGILSVEKLQDCIDKWNEYSFDRKKEIAKLFIKVITITDDEIQIIFK